MARIERRQLKDGRERYKAILRRKGLPIKAKTFGTRAAAEAWAKRQEVLILDRKAKPTWEAEKHTVSDAIDRYLRDHLAEEFPKREYARDRKNMLEWWRGKLGHLTLADLSPPAPIVEARQKLMRERGVSGPTANRYVAALSRVFKLAVTEWFWIEDSPTRNIPRKEDSKPRVRFLSDAERKALLEVCQKSEDPRLYPLVLFALTTGARQGELLGLRWGDVDLESLRATLQETKNRDRRSLHFAGAAGELLRKLSQTPHISGYIFAGPRTPLGEPPRMLLKPWAAALKAADAKLKSEAAERVEKARQSLRNAQRSRDPETIRLAAQELESARAAEEQAGLSDFRFHDLRHTAASYLAMTGATLPELAAFLGHRTLEVVRRYAHLTDQHQERVTQRMVDKYLADG